MSHLIHVKEIPGLRAPYGPYSTGVVDTQSRLITLSGRISPPSPNGESTTTERQTVRIMAEVHQALGYIGVDLGCVTSFGVFLDDRSDANFDAFNKAFGGYLDLHAQRNGSDPGLYPARYTAAPQLLKGAGVELVTHASLPPGWTPDVLYRNLDKPDLMDQRIFSYEDVMHFVERSQPAH